MGDVETRPGSQAKLRPSPSEPPDHCEFGDCERRPAYRVRYADPHDYVFYCGPHKIETADYPGRKYTKRL